jgi:protein ImuB
MTRLWPEGEPVQVETGPDGAPQAFLWRGARHPVAAVANRWRVRTGWWIREGEAWREYLKLTTADGLLCILAHDLRDSTWRLVRLYD